MGEPERLPAGCAAMLEDPNNSLGFSVASLWELVIKQALAVRQLPPLHRDPFDRLLLAQAQVEGMLLLTADSKLSRYPGPVRYLAG